MNMKIADKLMVSDNFEFMVYLIKKCHDEHDVNEVMKVINHVISENEIHDYDDIMNDAYLDNLDMMNDESIYFDSFDLGGSIKSYHATKNDDGSWNRYEEAVVLMRLNADEVKLINQFFNNHTDVYAYSEHVGIYLK